MGLRDFGWNDFLEKKFEHFKELSLFPGLVTEVKKNVYTLQSERGIIYGRLSRNIRLSCQIRKIYPNKGDWIAYKPSQEEGFVSIEGIFFRK